MRVRCKWTARLPPKQKALGSSPSTLTIKVENGRVDR